MKKAAIVGLVAAVFALVAAALLRQREATTERASVAASGRPVPTSVKRVKSTAGNSRPAVRRSRPKPASKPVLDFGEDGEDDSRTPAERALAERIERAYDEDDFDAVVACVDAARKCGVAEIRQSMVDALGWFGGKALPELLPFLADADEDVRESAQSQLSSGLSDIENDAERISIVESVMKVLDDGDFLNDVSGEYVGIDEKLAVESLMRIVAAGSPAGVAQAKETYELITGDEWTDAAGAERWIAEEYEPTEEP